MQVDYIIVGLGLAGLAFAETLEQSNKSFIVFNDASQQASKVAAGSYNPVILKRFTPVWDAEDQLKIALPFYKHLENKFNTQYDFELDIHRIFTSVEEQNDWFAACDKPVLNKYLQPQILQNSNHAIRAPFGFGNITKTGKVITKKLLADYENSLFKQDLLFNESFEYDAINFLENSIVYKDISAKRIVFCEGFGVKQNPFFNDVPMQEAKGELITIHAPDLKLKALLKSGVFVMPMGDDLYKVGATFNWKDKTSKPTEAGKKELLEKLEKIITVPFEIVDHVAGIRPTVKDRRPLLGVHSKYKQLAILNGLGTRGVMLAPKMAQLLYNFLEKGAELPVVVNINRFY